VAFALALLLVELLTVWTGRCAKTKAALAFVLVQNLVVATGKRARATTAA
jgi:hypothetical protein